MNVQAEEIAVNFQAEEVCLMWQCCNPYSLNLELLCFYNFHYGRDND